MSGTVDWDASSYHEVSSVQERWGLEVIEMLDLRGDEVVLDAGCGSGRLAGRLLAQLPEGRVIAVDGSPAMVEQARENNAAAVEEGRLEARVADLLDLELAGPVDAIFSNSVFHWVIDHDRLFRRLFSLLRDGGRLAAQFGSQGNVAELEDAIRSMEGDERFAAYLRGMSDPWYFAGLADTEERMKRAGFEDVELRLWKHRVRPVEPDWIVASGFQKHFDRLPPELHQAFADAVLGSMPRPLTLDYVHVRVRARRPE